MCLRQRDRQRSRIGHSFQKARAAMSTKASLRFHLLTVAVWLSAAGAALAQVPQFPQNLPASTVIGRLGIGPGPSQAITFSQLAGQLSAVGNYVKGPASSTIGHFATFNSVGGTLLADHTIQGSDLPNPSASTLGGVQSSTCSSHNWFSSLSTGGVFGCSQPSFADLTSSLACSQAPALTGDATTSAGSCATTIAANAVTNAKMAQAGAATLKGNPTAGTANLQDFTIQGLTNSAPNATLDFFLFYNHTTGTLQYATASQISSAVGSGVTSLNSLTGALSIVAGNGIIVTPSGSNVTVAVSQSTATNVLGADVALNNTANYFDGPSMAQGTSGTWFASGQVEVIDTGGPADIVCKLWDGTTVIASGEHNTNLANIERTMHLAGYLASPAGNIRISCRDITATTGLIRFNQSGNSKDSSIFGMRIQ
jgi:hypothetical protein